MQVTSSKFHDRLTPRLQQVSTRLKSYQTQILHQECFYGHNDSCEVSFQLVDVNLDFGIRARRTTEKAGPDRVKPGFHYTANATTTKQ